MEDAQKVYFGVSPNFELVAENYPCHVVKTRGIYHPHYGAYAFNKHSPYIEIFSYQIDNILEYGLETERRGATKKGDPGCVKHTAEFFRTLSYNDVNSAFGIFSLGCLLALAIQLLNVCIKVIIH